MKKSSDKLIKACIKGNRKAQLSLYLEYKDAMYALCLRYCKTQQDAEDILQNGFIKVFRDLHQYTPIAPLGAWIRKVIINSALEHIRRSKRQVVTDEYTSQQAVNLQASEPCNILEAEQLLKLIQSLNDDYRLVFNLFAIEGYSHAEIASLLKISKVNSKVRLNRARKLIQAKLEKHFQKSY